MNSELWRGSELKGKDLLDFLVAQRVLDEIGLEVKPTGNECDYALIVAERGTCIGVGDECETAFASNLPNQIILRIQLVHFLCVVALTRLAAHDQDPSLVNRASYD